MLSGLSAFQCLSGSTRVDGTLYYVHSDLLGSTVAVSDAAGGEVGRVQYDPYGEVITSTLPVTLTDRLFTGQRFDSSTGLYYYKARYYDPYLGRFIQPDTLVPDPLNPQAWNRFSYVYNNPTSYVDPTGHQGLPWWKQLIVDVLNTGQSLVTAPSRLAEGLSTGVRNIGNPEYALHPHTVSVLAECVRRSFIPGAADTFEITPLPGEAEQNVRALRNTGGWYFETTGAALETYGVVAPITYGTTNAIVGTLPKPAPPIGWTGDVGEDALRMLGGESQHYFRTTQGGRYVDQLISGIAHESKVGYTSLTKDVQLQIAKDVELIATEQIEAAVWHFFPSPVTGKVGPSSPLAEALREAGIQFFIHP